MNNRSSASALSRVANEELVAIRHAQLISAATELFLEKGFHKTTTRDIAAAVGWNMGTLYMYISCKEDILYLIARSIMHKLAVEQNRVEPKQTSMETLRAVAEYYFRTVAEMHQELRLLYRDNFNLLPGHREEIRQAELRVWDFFADIIQSGLDSGEFRRVNARIVAYDVIMLAHMWALKRGTLVQEYAFEPYLAEQLTLLSSLLRPDVASPNGHRSASD